MSEAAEPTAEFWRRIRVLVARQEIERLSRQLLCDAEGSNPGDRLHTETKSRLLLLVAGCPPDCWWDAYLLARRAGCVYADASDVLHGRRAFGDIPEVLVQEWEEVVTALKHAVAQRGPVELSEPN